MPEPVGVLGIVCPEEFSLLGFISTILPVIAMGNRVVVVPSEEGALIATDFYQVLDTSDVPAGTINIVTGHKSELLPTLMSHDDVDGIWYYGDKVSCKEIEHASADNMKRSWVNYGKHRNWMDDAQGQGREFLRHASEVKNIWVPYGA
jgi:aldehyde dehydrogenase (NAD+)